MFWMSKPRNLGSLLDHPQPNRFPQDGGDWDITSISSRERGEASIQVTQDAASKAEVLPG